MKAGEFGWDRNDEECGALLSCVTAAGPAVIAIAGVGSSLTPYRGTAFILSAGVAMWISETGEVAS